jgi:N-acetylmuramoyl-L-alanine amidase
MVGIGLLGLVAVVVIRGALGAAVRPQLAAGTPVLGGLAAGACDAFAPTGRPRSETVFLDPGHGGPDPGVIGVSVSGKPVEEKEVTLAVALDLAARLRSDGYRVVLSRTTDSSVIRLAAGTTTETAQEVNRDLEARIACANAAHAAVLLSIHMDGYDDPSVGGTETVYDPSRPFAAQNLRLAQDLQSALVAQLHQPDRGVVPDDQLNAPTLSDRADQYGHLLILGPPEPGYLDQASQMPGALVEPLFLTQPREAALAASASGQQEMAAALATGLERFLAG